MHGGVNDDQWEQALQMLPEDVHHSSLINRELAPIPIKFRTWSTYDYCSLWISMAHCLPTYSMIILFIIILNHKTKNSFIF